MDNVAPALAPSIQQHLGAHLAALVALPSALPAGLVEALDRLTAQFDARDGREGASFREGLVGALPKLRAYALSLCRNHHQADDLVQETMAKALRNVGKFEPGTNLQGWLFVILRNEFFSQRRRASREIEDAKGAHADSLTVAAGQEEILECREVLSALRKLPEEQREVLVLSTIEDLTYEQVAEIAGVPVGTVKSRLNRARARLTRLLESGRLPLVAVDAPGPP